MLVAMREACRFHSRGYCRYGHRCRFAHDLLLEEEENAQVMEHAELRAELATRSVVKVEDGRVVHLLAGPSGAERITTEWQVGCMCSMIQDALELLGGHEEPVRLSLQHRPRIASPAPAPFIDSQSCVALHQQVIRLPLVEAVALRDVIGICRRAALHGNRNLTSTLLIEDFLQWRAARPRQEVLLFRLLRAASYLGADALLAACCDWVHREMHIHHDSRRYDKGPAEWAARVRSTLGFMSDLTAKEEAAAEAEPVKTPPSADDAAASDPAEEGVRWMILQDLDTAALSRVKRLSRAWRAASRSILANGRMDEAQCHVCSSAHVIPRTSTGVLPSSCAESR